MEVPDRLLQLVDTFGRNLSVYKSGGYNEPQARVEFTDPLFGQPGLYGLTDEEIRIVEETTPRGSASLCASWRPTVSGSCGRRARSATTGRPACRT